MSSAHYFVINLKNVLPQNEDLISHYCFEFSAQGISEELDFKQSRTDYQTEVVEKTTKSLSVFFTQMPSEDFFLKISTHFPAVTIERKKEENKDWLAEWKKTYQPFPLAGPYWVVPTWLDCPEQAKKPIWIDPGMAFGTGTHATTQMMAKLIYDYTNKLKSSFTCLDVGTGTGILAFLARMQGASLVVATEIDPEARRVVRENIDLNKLSSIEVPEYQVEKIEYNFDLVCANIIELVLMSIKTDLLRCLKPGGQLLISGVLSENVDSFIRDFQLGQNLSLQEVIHQDEWVGISFRSLD